MKAGHYRKCEHCLKMIPVEDKLCVFCEQPVSPIRLDEE
jgi:RNA polymerase subunit RPABC4/transcription elongation factor Spt4